MSVLGAAAKARAAIKNMATRFIDTEYNPHAHYAIIAKTGEGEGWELAAGRTVMGYVVGSVPLACEQRVWYKSLLTL